MLHVRTYIGPVPRYIRTYICMYGTNMGKFETPDTYVHTYVCMELTWESLRHLQLVNTHVHTRYSNWSIHKFTK